MRPRRRAILAAAIVCVPFGASCGSDGEAVDVPAAAVEATTATTMPSTEPVATSTTSTTTTTVPPTTTAAPTSTTKPPPVTTAARPLVLMRRGDEGPRIRRFQQKLIVLGYLPADADNGVFDDRTGDAVLDFQSDYGLVVDGLVGPQTERAIAAAATSVNPGG